MPDIQHANIPDEFLHEAKHAEQASANTFLRAKGDGTTEFVFLSLESFQPPLVIRDDTEVESSFNTPLQLNRQYVITLVNSDLGVGDADYYNDVIDLRGMTVLPTGTGKLTSIGGTCEWQSGKLTCVKLGWKFFRVVEVS